MARLASREPANRTASARESTSPLSAMNADLDSSFVGCEAGGRRRSLCRVSHVRGVRSVVEWS
jgi:hypothetical protein